MRYGRGAPGKGWLPVFSVGSEAEAARIWDLLRAGTFQVSPSITALLNVLEAM